MLVMAVMVVMVVMLVMVRMLISVDTLRPHPLDHEILEIPGSSDPWIP